MKKIFCVLLLAVMLFTNICSVALGEQVQIPVLIDGVRVAFFDTAGNFLPQLNENGLVYVPLFSFCESLGMNAEVQGQSVSVDGVRIGMFDSAGNFLPPVQVNGIDYVPLVPFCEAIALDTVEENGKISITRNTVALTVAEEKESAKKIALHPYNFSNYFSYDVQDTNFKATQAKIGNGSLYANSADVDYVLTCNARSNFEIENVSFELWAETSEWDRTVSGIKGITFREDMPANGTLTKTLHASGDVLSSGPKATKATIASKTLKSVSGYIIVDKEKADAANQASFEAGEKYFANGAYEKALTIFYALEKIDYPQAAERANETGKQKRLAEEAAKAKMAETYWAAVALQESGEYEAAIALYESLGNYQDYVERSAECQKYIAYQTAVEKQSIGDYEDAMAIYEELGDFLDAQTKFLKCEELLNEPIYQKAIEAAANGKRAEAVELFSSVEEYKDASARAKALTQKYKFINSFHDGIASAGGVDGRGHYVDLNGVEIPVHFKYDSLEPFSEGYATTYRRESNGDYSYTFYFTYVDKNGDIVIPEQKCGCAYSFHDGYARIYFSDTKEIYYIDKAGNQSEWGAFKTASDFKNGFALAKDKEGNWFILNASDGTKTPFKEQFPAFPEDMNPHMDLLFYGVFSDSKGNFCDATGKQLGGFEYADFFSEGYARVQKGKQWGFVDPQMNLVIPFKWDVARNFSDGMSAVRNGTKWGFINQAGELIISCEWDYVENFHEGLAAVFRGTQTKSGTPDKGKWGYIDKTGKLVVPCEWDDAADFSEGHAGVLKDGYLTILSAEDYITEETLSSESSFGIELAPIANNAPAEVESKKYTLLEPGCDSQAVLDARMKLYELGYFQNKPTQTEYTTAMKDYVKKFEKDNGLKQDGILSPEDQEVLFGL